MTTRRAGYIQLKTEPRREYLTLRFRQREPVFGEYILRWGFFRDKYYVLGMTGNDTKENFTNTYSKKNTTYAFICLDTNSPSFISVTIFLHDTTSFDWGSDKCLHICLSTSGYEVSQVHSATLSHTPFPRISLSRCGFIQCYPRWACIHLVVVPYQLPHPIHASPGNRHTMQETVAHLQLGTQIRRREGVSASVCGNGSDSGDGTWSPLLRDVYSPALPSQHYLACRPPLRPLICSCVLAL